MPIYPTDVDDLRRSIGEAAILIASAIIYTSSPRMAHDVDEAVDAAVSILNEIRDIPR